MHACIQPSKHLPQRHPAAHTLQGREAEPCSPEHQPKAPGPNGPIPRGPIWPRGTSGHPSRAAFKSLVGKVRNQNKNFLRSYRGCVSHSEVSCKLSRLKQSPFERAGTTWNAHHSCPWLCAWLVCPQHSSPGRSSLAHQLIQILMCLLFARRVRVSITFSVHCAPGHRIITPRTPNSRRWEG